jgi:hypothetical protein
MNLTFNLIDKELEAFRKPRDFLWLAILGNSEGINIYADFGFINAITASP